MSARIEKTAVVKAQLISAKAELEHGDTTAAVLALCGAVDALLWLLLEQEQQTLAKAKLVRK